MPTPDLRDFILSVYVELFERNGKRIDKDPTEAELLAVAEECVLRDRKARDRSLLDERDALRAALEPSGETKAAYIGEFKIDLHRVDEAGDEYTEEVMVPWTTIKEVMAAIRARAALSQSTPQTEEAI